jgi:hypothetical protein
MAIISGLNLSAVSRLKTVKEDKANKVHILKLTVHHHILAQPCAWAYQVVNQLEDLMNPEASFKKYRDALQSAAPPTIPFVYGLAPWGKGPLWNITPGLTLSGGGGSHTVACT